MHRLAALLLCSLVVAFAALAAPAPVYKPDRTRWLGMAGWDRPACEGAGCTRHGHRLAVSDGAPVCGGERSFSLGRDAEGDFVLALRLKVETSDSGATRATTGPASPSRGRRLRFELGLSAHRGDGEDGFASWHVSQAGP